MPLVCSLLCFSSSCVQGLGFLDLRCKYGLVSGGFCFKLCGNSEMNGFNVFVCVFEKAEEKDSNVSPNDTVLCLCS